MNDDGRSDETGEPGDADARELLGAYSVNAVDDDERRQVEALLQRDPEAAAELTRHEAVLAALASSIDPIVPPASVWEATRARIASTPQVDVERADPEPQQAASTVTSISAGRFRARRAAVGAAVLAAAAIAAVVFWPGSTPTTPARDEVAEAYATPGRRVATLTGATGAGQPISVEVVVLPDGSGMVMGAGLPSAGSGNVYQLWSLDGTSPVSLGPLGESPAVVKFRSDHPITSLGLSVERSPSAQTPTLPPVAVGSLA